MNKIICRGLACISTKPTGGEVVEDVIKEANDGPENLYISFDINVKDPAYMAGTGTPEPSGITNRQAFKLLRRLCAESNVIGIDILELAPERDPGYTTVHNTNRLVRECMVGEARYAKRELPTLIT